MFISKLMYKIPNRSKTLTVNPIHFLFFVDIVVLYLHTIHLQHIVPSTSYAQNWGLKKNSVEMNACISSRSSTCCGTNSCFMSLWGKMTKQFLYVKPLQEPGVSTPNRTRNWTWTWTRNRTRTRITVYILIIPIFMTKF